MRAGAELVFASAASSLSFLTMTTTLEDVLVASAVAVVVVSCPAFFVMTMVVAQGVAYTVTVPAGHMGHTWTAVVATG